MLGTHVILDVYINSKLMTDMETMCKILTDSAIEVGCKILFVEKHTFETTDGYTAVIGLAESHISIHTWPEHNCCAIDIFMCGECNADRAANLILSKMGDLTYSKNIIKRL